MSALNGESDLESPKMEDRMGDVWYRVMCHGRGVWTLEHPHDESACHEDSHVYFSFEQLEREWGPLRSVA